MKKELLLFLVIAFSSTMKADYATSLLSSLDSCAAFNFPIAPADSCENAPPFCTNYLNGFCSANEGYSSYVPGNLETAFGCSIENNQWLSFVPCENTVTFVFFVDDCSNANGLEFGVFQTDNCQNFTAMESCFTVNNGITDTLSIQNLTIGDTYYLMIDGQSGDVCHWEITSLDGAAGESYFQADYTNGSIEGESDICLGLSGPPSDPFQYSVIASVCNLIAVDTTCSGEPVPCPAAPQQFCEPFPDTLYNPVEWDTIWRIIPPAAGYFANDDSIGMLVDVVWDSVGTFYLEVEIVPTEYDTIPFMNDCIENCSRICPDPEGDNCTIPRKEVNISMPDVYNLFFAKCPEECVPVVISPAGTISNVPPQDTLPAGVGTIEFCSPGNHDFFVIDDGGCVDQYFIEIIDFVPEDLFIELQEECPGECVVFNGNTYCPGSYQIPYIDNQGCEATIFLDVLEQPGGSVVIAASNDITCLQPDATLEAFADYPGPVDYFWSNGLSGPNITVNSGGNYTVDVFSANCLIGSASVFVSETTNETINLGEITLCPGECFELLGNSYCDEGSYVEAFTDPDTGCTDTYIFSLIIPMQMPMQIGPVTELCDGISETYTINFSIIDGVPPFSVNGNIINGDFYQSTPIPSGDAYFFNVEDNNVCGDNQAEVQGFFECPCLTGSGTMSLAQLNQCETDLVTPDFNQDASLDANDALVFVLHDNSGNTLGNVIGINATGSFGFVAGAMQYGVTYYISPVAGNEVNGSVDFNSACLSVGAGQPVVFYEIPELSLLPAAPLTCANPTEMLEAELTGGSGTFVFQWSGPQGFTSADASPLIDRGGEYTCSILDEVSGCFASQTITIEEDFTEPALDLISDGPITCALPVAELQAVSGNDTEFISWTLPDGVMSNEPAITADVPGVYTVVATGVNGCTTEEVLLLEADVEPPFLQAADVAINCLETVANPSAFSGTPGVSFAWVLLNNDTVSGVSIQTTEPGSYEVIATAPNGCTAVEEVLVNIDTLPPLLDVTGGELDCNHPSIVLNANTTTPGTAINWIFPTGNEVSGDSIFTDISGSYTVIATAPNGCSTTLAAQVTADFTVPDFQVSPGLINCLQTIDTLFVTSNTADVLFNWLLPDGSTWVGDSLVTDQSGDFQVTATGSNGCTATLPTTVQNEGAPPVFTLSFGEINCLQPAAILAADSPDDTDAFLWLFPNGQEVNGDTITTNLPGTYTLTVTSSDGCTATETFSVDDNTQPPSVSVNGDSLRCDDPIAELLASSNDPNVVFDWVLPDGSSFSGPLLQTDQVGSHLVVVTAQNGCVAETSTVVAEVADPDFILTIDWNPPTCPGDEDGFIVVSDVMGATGPYTVFVNNEEVATAGLSNLSPGDFEIVVTDDNGCTGDTLISLAPPQEILVDLGPDINVRLNEQIELSLQSNIIPATIQWFGPDGQVWDGVSSLTVVATDNGRYEVVVTDGNGCTGSDQVWLNVEGSGQVYIPSAFSPNGDNNNDYFTVYAGDDVEKVNSFMVFDRWGNMVFSRENFAPNIDMYGWDGTMRNKKMNPQVFAYRAEVSFKTGEIKVVTGDVVLVN